MDFNSIDRENFLIEEHIIMSKGESIFLVRPNPSAERLTWMQKNKNFCSSVWSNNGSLVSAGFPFFPNWGESAEEFPVPNLLDGCSIHEKMDGVLLIVSQYKGHRIVRTKEILDAEQVSASKEIIHFKNTYVYRIGDFYYDNKTWGISFLFEWLSSSNKLTINYGDKPRFILIGAINHADYTLVPQKDLDNLAGGLGLERPRIYTVDTVNNLINDVKKWDNREGVVVYSKGNQNCHKIKSEWYLKNQRSNH